MFVFSYSILKVFFIFQFHGRILNLLYGSCVPSTCDKDGVVRYITDGKMSDGN